MERKKVLVLCGPTASGKTAMGILLAKEYGGEVISADSMQIYKGMDIATAKPNADELSQVKHHLISTVDRNCVFSVARYVDMARKTIAEIHAEHKLPIVVGGTGLYISSLADNITFCNEDNNGCVRRRLSEEAKSLGNEAMLEKLKQIDPETAEALHPNNLNRIIRALEVFETTGITLSEQKRRSRSDPSPFDFLMLGIDYAQREQLYARINKRVDIMFENGLVEEAKEIFLSGNCGATSAQAIGYKELIPYFEGTATLEEAKEKIKQETRRYAKRQLTWFRRDKRINWIYCDENSTLENNLEKFKKIIAKSNFL